MLSRSLLHFGLVATLYWGSAAHAADYRALDSFFRNEVFRPTLSDSEAVPVATSEPSDGGSFVPASRIVSTIRYPSSYSPQERIVLSFQAASEAE